MKAGEDGPVVLHLLLFQAKLYLFIFKLELKLFREGCIWVTFLDVLQPKELVVMYTLTQHYHVHSRVAYLSIKYWMHELIPFVIG